MRSIETLYNNMDQTLCCFQLIGDGFEIRFFCLFIVLYRTRRTNSYKIYSLLLMLWSSDSSQQVCHLNYLAQIARVSKGKIADFGIGHELLIKNNTLSEMKLTITRKLVFVFC